MELRIYKGWSLQGLLENYSSLLWTRRYSTCGEFEAVFPITKDTITLLQVGNLVTYRGAPDWGVIESRRIEESSDTKQITVSGRFLPALLDRRVILGTVNFVGEVGTGIREILLNHMNAIPYFIVESITGTPTVRFQVTYKNVLSYIEKLCSATNVGFRVYMDLANRQVVFQLYTGVDRSYGQTANPRVEFSERYGNIERTEYTEDERLFRNVAYVGGEGEGSQRVYVVAGDTTTLGSNRREMFVDARDLRSDGLTTAQYEDALKQRGLEKLAENERANALECEVIPMGNFNYRTDYDLGDVVTVIRNDYGISESLRITEIMEVYEHGRATIVPTFGKTLPTKVDWEDK